MASFRMNFTFTVYCQINYHYLFLWSHLMMDLGAEICCKYRGADKSLALPGRKQANVSVRMTWISFGALQEKKT